MDVLEQLNGILGIKLNNIDGDQYIFDRMAHFIMDLDPGQLTDEELEKAVSIINQMDIEPDMIGVEEQATAPVRRSGRTSPDKKQYMKQYYRQNKGKIKRRKRRLERSAEYRKRMRSKDRLARANRTPTGKRKVRYNV